MYEDDFILNAARTKLSKRNISVLKKISKNDIDWDSVTKKATAHRVSTLIYYSLTQYKLSELIPVNVYELFKIHYYKTAEENSIFLQSIKTLVNTIKDKIIFLKGSDLIQNLYPDIAIRSMYDINILIEKKYAEKNWNKLQNSGFNGNLQISKSAIHNNPFFCKLNHWPALYSKSTMIEVHWNLYIKKKIYPVTKAVFRNSRKTIKNIYVLSNEFTLIMLSSHFCKYVKFCAILRMLCDINELIVKYKNTINWEGIKKMCFEPELKNDVYTALTYAHWLLKTPIPKEFILKESVLRSSITIDSLITSRNIPKRSSWHYFFSTIHNLCNLIVVFIFVFRTIVPIKAWIKSKYEVTTNRDLLKAYIKYWIYMFDRHILQKPVTIENWLQTY